MNVVIDTNVLVSSLWSRNGTCSKILYKVLNYDLTIVYDQRIISEYKTVLERPKFGFTKDEVKSLIDFIKIEGLCIVPNPLNLEFTDESDKKFYEVAKYMKCPLITGNKKHFPYEDEILSPTEFLERYK